MATYYVGPGGSDAASGLSYALRKLTLNGAEDVPITAGSTVYVAPGVYRELLTVDVSGTAGNPISYVADVSGALTDGIGGIVRITGSDNDTTATRANCITATSKDYRTFTGFTFDTTTGALLLIQTASSNWIVQDCHFSGQGANTNTVTLSGTGTTNVFRRCFFGGGRGTCLGYTHTVVVDNAANVVENCLFLAPLAHGITDARIGGITVKNCVFVGCNSGILVSTALTVGQTIAVNNCIFVWNTTAVNGTVSGEIVENYNAFWGNATDRTNTATGANSNIFPPLFNPQLLLSGFKLPQLSMFGLSEWSALRAITGTGTAADDLYGVTRPATAAKLSWGAIQKAMLSRETTTVRTGAASLKLADAGSHQIYVQTSNVSTVFSVYVQWEADYAGTKPQLIIKQPGQADVTVTATGSSGAWELLTTTLTPAASPGYCIVELKSSNTAASTNFDTFWDDLVIRAA